MKVQEAVVTRIRRLCSEKNIKISQLAYNAGMPPSTLKNIMKGNSNNTGIVTIKMICDGLNITLDDFFIVSYLEIWNRKLTSITISK